MLSASLPAFLDLASNCRRDPVMLLAFPSGLAAVLGMGRTVIRTASPRQHTVPKFNASLGVA